MHKLMHKGLKKKKKSKKGKKDLEEEEFNPEELERYRRERAEALVKASSNVDEQTNDGAVTAAGSDEWKKFQALTAGVDSILKKTQGDLDRIKSTSFFQRKAPVIEEKKPEEDPEITKNKAKRWVGFDKSGNPIEQVSTNKDSEIVETKLSVSETGFVEIPDDDDDDEDGSADEDIFDTTYVDVLQKIDVQLAYIPDSPTEEELGDDPFDTTNADKVLKTVDKHGKKVVSLGNAVEVLSGRIDHVSTCKISRPQRGKVQDLLLGDFDSDVNVNESAVSEPYEIKKTLLDDDDNSELPDVPIDLTDLTLISAIIKPVSNTDDHVETVTSDSGLPLDISEFEIIKEKKILEEIPDLDDDFDLDGPIDESVQLEDAADPFAEKESNDTNIGTEIIEASFEAASFVNEEDPFDTTFAENLVPGKTELKFIEKELDELPESSVAISLTDPSGLHRDYETGLLTATSDQFSANNHDLLGGSNTDLTQLTDQPINPVEEISYTDPFDTSGIQEPVPGQTELKFLEEELLSKDTKVNDSLEDDDFDPRLGENYTKSAQQQTQSPLQFVSDSYQNYDNNSITNVPEKDVDDLISNEIKRKTSRPEVLGVGPVKFVAFDLPTPSQRPDLLITGEEEKSIKSNPLTPYYSQKSLEESIPEQNLDTAEIDPFDTSFVSEVKPGKTELKLIESELLKQETKLTHSTSEHEINTRFEIQSTAGRRQSDFGATSTRPKNLTFSHPDESLIEDNESININTYEIKKAINRTKSKPKRQESLLDAEVIVDAKPLTPRIESKIINECSEEELTYVDPFDTSIATNILPGKAELKQLENELSQISSHVQPISVTNRIDFSKVTSYQVSAPLRNEDDFDPRADEINDTQDFLSLDGEISGDKVLTPVQNSSSFLDDSVDPFDTSFAIVEPGKTELKLLESELMDK